MCPENTEEGDLGCNTQLGATILVVHKSQMLWSPGRTRPSSFAALLPEGSTDPPLHTKAMPPPIKSTSCIYLFTHTHIQISSSYVSIIHTYVSIIQVYIYV